MKILVYLCGAMKKDVQNFLERFKLKARVFGLVFFGGRQKNLDTLALLSIPASYRDEVVMGLQVEDYSEGPLPEQMHGFNEMWVFGK